MFGPPGTGKTLLAKASKLVVAPLVSPLHSLIPRYYPTAGCGTRVWNHLLQRFGLNALVKVSRRLGKDGPNPVRYGALLRALDYFHGRN
jgi:MoxR-like ATPase